MNKLKYIWTIFFIGFSIMAFSQQEDAKIYNRTYKFLKNKELKNYADISIADSIVFIEYSLCFDKLKNPKVNDRLLIDSLSNIDTQRKFIPYFYNSKVLKNSKSILFFSKPYKNTLLVEFFTSKGFVSNSYSKLTSNGESTLFLIYFSRCKRIKKYVTVPINYN